MRSLFLLVLAAFAQAQELLPTKLLEPPTDARSTYKEAWKWGKPIFCYDLAWITICCDRRIKMLHKVPAVIEAAKISVFSGNQPAGKECRTNQEPETR